MQLFTRDGREMAQNATTEKGRPLARWQGPCKRCGGTGRFSFDGETDRCYRCGGSRPMTYDLYAERLYTADELAKLNTRREALRAKKAAKAEAARLEIEAQKEAAREARRERLKSDELFQLLTKYADRNEFVAELLGKYRVADLSEKQEAAARAACERFAKRDQEAATSQHVGVVGERIALALRCTVSKCIHRAEPGTWVNGRPDASRWLNKFVDDAGNVFVYFSSRPFVLFEKMGNEYKGTAKVKQHDTYEGVAQTIISNFRLKKGETKQ